MSQNILRPKNDILVSPCRGSPQSTHSNFPSRKMSSRENVEEQTANHLYYYLFLYWRSRKIEYCYSIQSSRCKDDVYDKNKNNIIASFEALLMLSFSGTFHQDREARLKVEDRLLELLHHLTNIQSLINVDCFVALGFSNSIFQMID